MASVEFSELKATVPIVEVALRMLNLPLTMRMSQPKDGGAPYETWRGSCPICRRQKVFAVTPKAAAWWCHNCKKGGDCIKLVSTVRCIQARDAAIAIQEFSGNQPPTKTEPDRSSQLDAILERLQPEHERIQALGISPETARAFESGYNPSGKQKGRYSVAIRDIRGQLVAFAGLGLDGELTAFANFDPETAMLNQHRLAPEEEILLFKTPLDAILAVENGAPIETVTAPLTDSLSSRQLEYLAGLLDHLRSPGLLL